MRIRGSKGSRVTGQSVTSSGSNTQSYIVHLTMVKVPWWKRMLRWTRREE